MKLSVLAAVFLSATAFADTSTPTGDKIQFDVVASISSCKLDNKGNLISCEDQTGTRVRETLTGELIHNQCTPACTYNDSVDLSKSYKLVIPGTKQILTYDLSIWFNRGSEIYNDTVPEYTVQATVGPKGKSNLDDRPALVTVKDLDALESVMVNASSITKRQRDGTYIQLEPSISLLNFKIVK